VPQKVEDGSIKDGRGDSLWVKNGFREAPEAGIGTPPPRFLPERSLKVEKPGSPKRGNGRFSAVQGDRAAGLKSM